MDTALQFLLDYGYIGMFLASFLAGSILPFSSEALLVAFVQMGLNPVLTVLSATLGNTAGSMTCYWIGHLGKMEYVERWLKVKPEKLAQAERFIRGRGAWMAFFSFLPVIGDGIAIVLGLMRASLPVTLFSMTLGKLLRYILLVLAAEGVVRMIF